ncbi:MAG: tRNA (adenine-N1)-methyltransferase [Candidatus Omnitrophica bacterium]|nr:tRNA (adenine-N1)-methyltransferase [Candidatus Omnitrophota bacterium]
MSVDIETKNVIKDGSLVLLWFERKEVSYLVRTEAGKKFPIHCGRPLAMDEWIGLPYGTRVKCDHGEGYLLNPTVEDLMMKASRESGIIYPKDAAFLIMKAGIRPGSKVLEIGTGSGSLTMALAQAVAPHGHVHTFDRRSDLPKNAHKNIKRAGLEEYVTFHQREAGQEIPEKDFDAAILDIPTPWEEMGVVKKAIAGGGHIVSLNPTFNQIEKAAEAMRCHGFINVASIELLERSILAREGKTRPVQRMVSHTEFLVFGTRVLENPNASAQTPPAEEEMQGSESEEIVPE